MLLPVYLCTVIVLADPRIQDNIDFVEIYGQADANQGILKFLSPWAWVWK